MGDSGAWPAQMTHITSYSSFNLNIEAFQPLHRTGGLHEKIENHHLLQTHFTDEEN